MRKNFADEEYEQQLFFGFWRRSKSVFCHVSHHLDPTSFFLTYSWIPILGRKLRWRKTTCTGNWPIKWAILLNATVGSVNLPLCSHFLRRNFFWQFCSTSKKCQETWIVSVPIQDCCRFHTLRSNTPCFDPNPNFHYSTFSLSCACIGYYEWSSENIFR